ncbi:MAG: TetR/AcrR family transcriptional regulator [Planctomycetota bacterium]
MNTLSPKKQQMLEREERILAVARPIIVQDGYHGLSMERIAAEVEYSKGTIYNHFSCKEEIIIALAIQTANIRVELFKRAAQFKGSSRFRMVAIGYAAEKFVRDYPDFFLFEQILQIPSVRSKVSEKRQNVVDNCEVQCMTVVTGIVRDAIAAEDLELPPGFSPEKLVFGMWALTSGGFTIASSSESLRHIGLENPFDLISDHTATLLDGFGWSPLSTDYDKQATIQRICEEVFGDE